MSSDLGLSPSQQVLRRLLRDPLAVGMALIVAVVVTACIAAPWIAPCSPTQQRAWLGALPPGAQHVDVRDRNELVVGERPQLSEALLRDGALLITVDWRDPGEDFRVQLRGGVVAIQRVIGAESVERLDLSAAMIVSAEGTSERLDAAPALLAVSGDAPPDGLFPEGKRLLRVRVIPPPRPATISAQLVAGFIGSLHVAGVAATRAVIAGEQVRTLTLDGRALLMTHPLGTDRFGRDLLSRIVYGGRISLAVGFVATLVSVIIGSLYGAIAGYVGGRTDRLMMAAVDVLYALPFIFLVILLLVLFGRSFVLLFAALGAVQWLTQARIVRAQVLSLIGRDFVTAARAAGLPGWRIVLIHLLPNCWGPIIAYGALTVPLVIMEESFLAFIGLGVSTDGVDSWGGLINAGTQVMGSGSDWLLWWPISIMTIMLIALTILGDRLRRALVER